MVLLIVLVEDVQVPRWTALAVVQNGLISERSSVAQVLGHDIHKRHKESSGGGALPGYKTCFQTDVLNWWFLYLTGNRFGRSCQSCIQLRGGCFDQERTAGSLPALMRTCHSWDLPNAGVAL